MENEPLESFLSLADREEQAELRSLFSRVEFESGSYVFFEGDEASSLFLVASGVVEANIVHPDGRLYIFHFTFPGETLGEGAAVGKARYPFSALVKRDAALWKISRRDLARAVESNPALNAYLLEQVGAKLYGSLYKERCIAGERVENRLACVLLKAIGENGLKAECPQKIAPPLTNRDISGLVGSTEETVSRIMSRLKKEKVVATENKHVVILDSEALGGIMRSR